MVGGDAEGPLRRLETAPAVVDALLFNHWRAAGRLLLPGGPLEEGGRHNFRAFYLLLAGAPRAVRGQLSLGGESDYAVLGAATSTAAFVGGEEGAGSAFASPPLSPPRVPQPSDAFSPRDGGGASGLRSSGSRGGDGGGGGTAVRDAEDFEALCSALSESGGAAAGPQQHQLWRLLSALLMAGNVHVRDRPDMSTVAGSGGGGGAAPPPGSAEIHNPSEALLLAELLGVDRGTLLHTLVKRTRGVVVSAAAPGTAQSAASSALPPLQSAVTFAYKRGVDARAGLLWLISTAYARLFRWLMAQMNRELVRVAAEAAAAVTPSSPPPSSSTVCTLALFDAPGCDDVFPGSTPACARRTVGTPSPAAVSAAATGSPLYGSTPQAGEGAMGSAIEAAAAGCDDDAVSSIFGGGIGGGGGAVYGLDALLTHYAAERTFAATFLAPVFYAEAAAYTREAVVVPPGGSVFYTDNAPLLDFLGDPRTGLLPLLDEAADFSRSSDALFHAKLVTMHRRTECMVPAAAFAVGRGGGRGQQQQPIIRAGAGASGSLLDDSAPPNDAATAGPSRFRFTDAVAASPTPSLPSPSASLLFGVRHACGVVRC